MILMIKSIGIISAGSIKDPYITEDLLRRGVTDPGAMGRPLSDMGNLLKLETLFCMFVKLHYVKIKHKLLK